MHLLFILCSEAIQIHNISTHDLSIRSGYRIYLTSWLLISIEGRELLALVGLLWFLGSLSSLMRTRSRLHSPIHCIGSTAASFIIGLIVSLCAHFDLLDSLSYRWKSTLWWTHRTRLHAIFIRMIISLLYRNLSKVSITLGLSKLWITKLSLPLSLLVCFGVYVRGLWCRKCKGRNWLNYGRIISMFKASHEGNVDKLSQCLN